MWFVFEWPLNLNDKAAWVRFGLWSKKKTIFLWLPWERFGSVSFQIMRIVWRSLVFEMEGCGCSWRYRNANRILRRILGLNGEEWTGSRTKFLNKWHHCFYIPSQFISIMASRKFTCTVHFVHTGSMRKVCSFIRISKGGGRTRNKLGIILNFILNLRFREAEWIFFGSRYWRVLGTVNTAIRIDVT